MADALLCRRKLLSTLGDPFSFKYIIRYGGGLAALMLLFPSSIIQVSNERYECAIVLKSHPRPAAGQLPQARRTVTEVMDMVIHFSDESFYLWLP